MDSLKKIVLQWLGIYDILLEVDRLKKDVAHYKAKLEYYASASAGVADHVMKLAAGKDGKLDDAHKMLEYLAGCLKKREL